jgi:hypothetical protein
MMRTRLWRSYGRHLDDQHSNWDEKKPRRRAPVRNGLTDIAIRAAKLRSIIQI